MSENKKYFTSYLSKEVADLAKFLTEREEVTKVVFVRRAIRTFMEGDHHIDDRLRITAKTDPNYVVRGSLYTVYLEENQKEQLKQVATEQGCTLSQVFFQVMMDYCIRLISEDNSGVTIRED